MLISVVKLKNGELVSTKNPQIFLCHASEDKAQVTRVYERLKKEGFRPWLDKIDLLAGQLWQLEIPKAIKASDFVLIFLSNASVQKRSFVQKEFKFALDVLQEIPKGEIYVIPVRLDECEVPQEFQELHWANLFEDDGFENIMKSIQAGMKSRSSITDREHALENKEISKLDEQPVKKEAVQNKTEKEKQQHLKALNIERSAEILEPAVPKQETREENKGEKSEPIEIKTQLGQNLKKTATHRPSTEKDRGFINQKFVWSILVPILVIITALYIFKTFNREPILKPAQNRQAQADLDNQVKAITARQDSTINRQQEELRLVIARLKEEESKSERNHEEIKRLTGQAKWLDENIKNTKSEKEQLRTIVPAYLSLILVLDKIKVFRDGSGGAAMWRFEISANQSIPLELGERKYESPNTYDEFDINNLEFIAKEQKEFVVTVIGEREKHKAEGKMTIIWEKNRERPKAFSIDVIETPEGKKEGHFTFSFRIEKKSN